MQRLLHLIFVVMMPSFAAAHLVPFDNALGPDAWSVGAPRATSPAAPSREPLERAVSNYLKRRLTDKDRELVSRVDEERERNCRGRGAVWLGPVSSPRSADFVVVCEWPLLLGFEDGSPSVSRKSPTSEGCTRADGSPCPIEVRRLPSEKSGASDVHIRAPMGCYLFYWEANTNMAELGAVYCKESSEEVLAAREACRRDAGTIVKVGMRASLECLRPTKDAGKSCIDKSQCEGFCLSDSRGPDGAPAVGRCTDTKGPSLGCRSHVTGGKLYACAIE